MDSMDDFDIVDDFKTEKSVEQPSSVDSLKLEIHSLRQEDSVLISTHPPREPETKITHVPCDIVLVIDVSGSMATEAPLPDAQDQGKKESSGLSILDLTKHAARTVLESLNDGDRLGIVTFSYDAEVIQPLTAMSAAAKKETEKRIAGLVDHGATNLWDGIQTGLKLFEDVPVIGNVQGLYILTDGMPNHMCPRKGYIPTLGPILKKMASRRACMPSIYTFGFGYSIHSHLLQSIAEIGDGNYAFIPDAGMIGTVFVHAVANLQSTYATAARLEIRTSNPSATLLYNSGIPVDSSEQNHLVLRLGNILYGQSRDVVVPYQGLDRKGTITTELTYKFPDGTTKTVSSAVAISAKTNLPTALTTYHLYRNKLCTFLSSLFPTTGDEDRKRPQVPSGQIRNQMLQLANSISTTLSSQSQNTDLLSLKQDLLGKTPDLTSESEVPSGQIHQALLQDPKTPYWTKWGSHYLPSLLHAHMRQTCNTFKDPGPLRYGTQSPLFIQCRDTLDALFDRLPAPKPSVAVRKGYSSVTNVRMSRYHNSNNPCFLGSCEVLLSDRRSVRVEDLRVGMEVWNPLIMKGVKVQAVVESRTTFSSNGEKNVICQIPNSSLWITPYHPIFHNGQWIFPHEVASPIRDLEVDECVYSVLLSPAHSDVGINPDSHAIVVGGIVCTTLGHGLTSQSQLRVSDIQEAKRDVRPHAFFGDYDAVKNDISRLKINEKGHFVSRGVVRDEITGLVCGFLGQDKIGGEDGVVNFDGIENHVTDQYVFEKNMSCGELICDEGRWMTGEVEISV